MSLTRGNDWRTSSYSTGTGQCVQVGWSVRVRDSRNPDWPELVFTPEQWASFTAALKEAS